MIFWGDCNLYGDEMQEEQKALSQGQSLEEFKALHISDSYKLYSEEIWLASSSSQIEQLTVSYVHFQPSNFDRCISAVSQLLYEKYFLAPCVCLFLVMDQYYYSVSMI